MVKRRGRFLVLGFTAFAIGCGEKKPSAANDPVEMGLLVRSESHKVVVWVNEEPVKVILPGSGGAVPLYWVGETGENKVWVTTEREGGDDGSRVSVEIKEGTWLEPENIIDHFSWQSGEDKDRSPTFTYRQSTQVGSSRTTLRPLSVAEDEIGELVAEQYRTIAEALEAKDLSRIGIERVDYNRKMRELMGIEDFYGKVFGIEDYTSKAIVDPEELEVVLGKRTFLAYPTNGEPVFRAGPLDRESSGEMKLSMIIESISMGYDGEKWVLSN